MGDHNLGEYYRSDYRGYYGFGFGYYVDCMEALEVSLDILYQRVHIQLLEPQKNNCLSGGFRRL